MLSTTHPTQVIRALEQLGLGQSTAACCTGQEWFGNAGLESLASVSPVNGQPIGQVAMADENAYHQVVAKAQEAFVAWRQVPAPVRGEVVRQIGDALRAHKAALGTLVSYEMGKIYQEGLGEVQEMIDICDFAVGLSRQLYGLTMHSERPSHRMYEQYHPLGVVGVISAFNFPVAVWSWNAMIAAVCGDVTIWKPSEKTPLCAVACMHIIAPVLKANNVPEGTFSLVLGGAGIGAAMAADSRVPLVSATGSTRMGKHVGAAVGARLGRALLELGGNNAIIITEKANIEMAIRAAVFGAVGTAGQRCTTTRRLIIADAVYEQVKERLTKIYATLSIGDPLDAKTLVGPLIDRAAVEAFTHALAEAKAAGGQILFGGQVLQEGKLGLGNYVVPAIVEAENHFTIVQEETFAPIVYLIRYQGDVTAAIAVQNQVKQGLSSSIFTDSLQEAETFLAHWGSDCGIANVNIGTSGAEIGGAFGGEKETGGGREAGSDAWKIYMRRQTNTINYGKSLPLAQGIQFNV